MTEKTLVLEKREYHSNNRRVCLVTPDTDNKTSTSFLMPEVILLPPYIPDKKRVGGLRSSFRDVTTIRSAKTVHFNVPLAETLYFHYQDDEDEESRFEDAFLDFYTKSFHMPQLYIIPPLPTYNKVVYLERMDWHTSLFGAIVVDNLGYKKDVMVRVTLDDWKSHTNIDAQYKESIDCHHDRFVFSISIPEPYALLTCRLAIQYVVNGDCYWDNNNAKNYTIRWLL